MQRRGFLAGVAACAMAPAWAGTGAAYLTAANKPDNSTWLLGLSAGGDVRFTLPLPTRGHAAAAHPHRAEAVGFARRPGRFAIVLDCTTGAEIARLTSPETRHFYGHGAYTADGAFLLTTENDFDGPDGRIGVWDVGAGYRRVDDLPSGGIGPHEIIRLPDGGFAVANGGIQTHPANDRAKLNLPTMRTNLTWLTAMGQHRETQWAPDAQRQNSIRHIASDATGRVVAALQWQGNPISRVPLLAHMQRGGDMVYLPHPETARLKHYAGSVAITADGRSIAVTGPKGGVVLFFDGQTGAAQSAAALTRASGVAPRGTQGFSITTAQGLIAQSGATRETHPVDGAWVFDNHLIAV